MHVAATTSTAHVVPASPPAERAEGPGPDHDGDADDAGRMSAVSTARPTSGTRQGGAVYL